MAESASADQEVIVSCECFAGLAGQGGVGFRQQIKYVLLCSSWLKKYPESVSDTDVNFFGQ